MALTTQAAAAAHAGRARSAQEVIEGAYKRSVHTPPAEQAGFVLQVLGGRLAAASLGLKDTRTLGSWARGGLIKGVDAEHRLQVLFRVTTAIEQAFTPAVAAAFLRGSNPVLGDRAPLLVLADDPPGEAEPRLVAALEALLTA